MNEVLAVGVSIVIMVQVTGLIAIFLISQSYEEYPYG